MSTLNDASALYTRQVSQRISIKTMGGYSSGRPAYYGVIESACRLDIRLLRRRGCLQPGTRRGWSWSQYGESAGSIAFSVYDDAIELDYVIGESDARQAVRIRIPLTSRPCRYGGVRSYFLCPYCDRTCEVVVMTTSGRSWGCRKCLRLRYRLAPRHRIQRRAEALYDRAGTDNGDGFVVKHKWMRWRTFNRLVNRADVIGGAADVQFASRIARLGKTAT